MYQQPQQQRQTFIDPNNRRSTGTPTTQLNPILNSANGNITQQYATLSSQGSILSSHGSTNNMTIQQNNQLPPHPDTAMLQPQLIQQHQLDPQTAQQPVQQFAPPAPVTRALDDEKVYQWIVELCYGPDRERALLELGKRRELYDDLPLVLWNSFGAMTALLDEIISVYPLLSPPNLSSNASTRVCNALALLQCIAAHQETRNLFLHAHIPLFLYPFLNTISKQRTFEYLRLTSLGVIGALVKNDTPEVISFLLTTEIIPLCLRIMESSSELSKTVAIFIVQKILVDDAGLAYVCQTYERFSAVANVLKIMVDQLVNQQTTRLLKHVVRCYLRLSDNPDARKALERCLPESLRDATFHLVLRDDTASRKCLHQLLLNLRNYEAQQAEAAQAQVQVQAAQVQAAQVQVQNQAQQFPAGLQRPAPQQQRV